LNPTAFGALLLQLSQTGANFSYHSSDGSILDSGFIPCVPGGSTVTTAANSTPATIATTTLVGTPVRTPAPTATLVHTPTNTPILGMPTVITGTLAPAALSDTTDIPTSAYKTPAFFGVIAFAAIAILAIVFGLIILARRRV
jgi:hypothetical protein